tara:strand:- start:616 stop:1188 length:573 start_codon:yes stop_codon:yes gene_type:complete
MKLSELKKMVAEEYSRYLAEQDQPPMPPSPGGPAGGPAISVEPDDIHMGEDPEQMLRNIYDMLKGHFEAEEMGMGAPSILPTGPPAPGGAPMPPAPDMGDDEDMVDMDDDNEMGDVEIDDEEEETVAENSTKEAAYQKDGHKKFAKKKHGVNAPYTKKAGKGSTKNAGYDASSKALQEVKRMQKLANLIK